MWVWSSKKPCSLRNRLRFYQTSYYTFSMCTISMEYYVCIFLCVPVCVHCEWGAHRTTLPPLCTEFVECIFWPFTARGFIMQISLALAMDQSRRSFSFSMVAGCNWSVHITIYSEGSLGACQAGEKGYSNMFLYIFCPLQMKWFLAKLWGI